MQTERFYSAGYESVTATFAHGSRGDQFSELRATEIKGLMRLWFRIALNGRIAPDALRIAEGELFGDNERFGERLRVGLTVEGGYRENISKGRSAIPHKVETPSPNANGEAPAEAAKKSHTARRRGTATKSNIELPSSLNPGVKILVSVDTLRAEEGTPQSAAEHMLWLALTLGGLGSRIRRAAGSFTLKGAASSQENSPLPWNSEGGSEEWGNYVRTGVLSALRSLQSYLTLRGLDARQQSETLPHHPQLSHPEAALYLLPKEYTDETELRKELMLSLRKFKNESFGLPLRHPGKKTPPGRFPSPLWLRGIRCGGAAAPLQVQGVLTPPYPAPGAPLQGDVKPERIQEFLKESNAQLIVTFSEIFDAL